MIQTIKFFNSSILSSKCILQEGLKVGTCVTQVRYRKKIKIRDCFNPRKAWKRDIPLKLFDPDLEKSPISASVPYEDMVEVRKKQFADDLTSLTARGFHRFQKPYDPPSDAAEKFIAIVKSLQPSLSQLPDKKIEKVSLNDPQLKYDILTTAAKEFQHSVPNSMLPAIRTIGAATRFYETPISTSTPFDMLVRLQDQLPPNLYIQKEPIRFTEDTMHAFDGISAFPKDSNIVTGLRAKLKYKAYKAKKSWP